MACSNLRSEFFFFFFFFFFLMLCQCSVTVMMFLQQCVAISVFVTMLLYIICNHMLVTGYVLLAFGEITCNK